MVLMEEKLKDNSRLEISTKSSMFSRHRLTDLRVQGLQTLDPVFGVIQESDLLGLTCPGVLGILVFGKYTTYP